MRKRVLAIVLAFMMLLSASPALAASKDGINTLKLDKNYLSLVVGNVYNFDVWQDPSTAANKPYRWYTSNNNIVKISGSTAYAVGVGRAVVSVTTDDGSVSDTCIIDVGVNSSNNSGSNNTNPVLPPNYYYPNNYYMPSYGYTGPFYPYYPYYGYDANNPYYGVAPSDMPDMQKPVESFVIPGKATDAVELGVELRQSTVTTLDGRAITFHFSRSSETMTIKPQTVDYSKVNGVSFRGNILNRLKKFGFKTVEYSVGDQVRVFLSPDMNNEIQNTVSVQKITPSANMATAWAYGDSALSGPWRISTNVEKDGLQFRFYLPKDSDLNKSDMTLVKWSEEKGAFEAIAKDAWVLKRYTGKNETGKFIETNMGLSQGVYAVVLGS